MFFQTVSLITALFKSRSVSEQCAPGAAGPCSELLGPGSRAVEPAAEISPAAPRAASPGSCYTEAGLQLFSFIMRDDTPPLQS